MRSDCVFFGGKQLGVNCLRVLLSRFVRPHLVVPNRDDNGSDTWHESLVRVARDENLHVLEGRRPSDPEIVEAVRRVQPEIAFCIGGMHIVPNEMLRIPGLGTLNIHPALLPRYRGRFSIPHAIFNGETETGATLHWMTERVDAGPVISQQRIPIEPDETARDVYAKFTRTGTQLFEAFLDHWLSGGTIHATPQDESQATDCPRGLPNGGSVDWSWPGERIRNFIRSMAFPPFDPAGFPLGRANMVVVEDDYFSGYSATAAATAVTEK